MKQKQNPNNRICALFHAANSIMGLAKSPIIILPIRAWLMA